MHFLRGVLSNSNASSAKNLRKFSWLPHPPWMASMSRQLNRSQPKRIQRVNHQRTKKVNRQPLRQLPLTTRINAGTRPQSLVMAAWHQPIFSDRTFPAFRAWGNVIHNSRMTSERLNCEETSAVLKISESRVAPTSPTSSAVMLHLVKSSLSVLRWNFS